MDFKEAQEQLVQLQAEEDTKTIEFLRAHFEAQSAVLDVSNKFLFDSATEFLTSHLRKHYSKANSLRKIVLQNTMLETPKLNSLLRGLLDLRRPLALCWLDIGNNRVDMTADTAELIGKLLSKKVNNRSKTLVLQGNLVRQGSVITSLFSHIGALQELNLYDTRLSPEALAALAEALSLNRKIRKVDLGYNASAFTDKAVLASFGMGVSLNTHLEYLNLCGNQPLHKASLLTAFCSGLQCSKSLEYCGLGGLGLGDKGVDLLTRCMLKTVPVCDLDLHNNSISARGLGRLFATLSVHVSSLDLSYNQIKDESVLLAIAEHLLHTRSLRKLNISHTIEIEELSFKAKQRLADAIKTNDSLTEFYCEGAKIGDDPDDFCEIIGAAISERRLSLTFKISAVDCFKGSAQISSYRESSYASSSQGKSLQLMQPQVNSTLQTERRNFEVESREESLSETPREYCFTGSSQLDHSAQ